MHLASCFQKLRYRIAIVTMEDSLKQLQITAVKAKHEADAAQLAALNQAKELEELQSTGRALKEEMAKINREKEEAMQISSDTRKAKEEALLYLTYLKTKLIECKKHRSLAESDRVVFTDTKQKIITKLEERVYEYKRFEGRTPLEDEVKEKQARVAELRAKRDELKKQAQKALLMKQEIADLEKAYKQKPVLDKLQQDLLKLRNEKQILQNKHDAHIARLKFQLECNKGRIATKRRELSQVETQLNRVKEESQDIRDQIRNIERQ